MADILNFTGQQRTLSPIVLQYFSHESGRRWMLNFQIEPIPDIIFVGDEPEMPEIIAVLANMHAPVWMIGLIDVVIKTKLRERTAQKSPPPSNAH